MAFDFSKTEAAKESSYLKPGVYAVKVTAGKFDKAKSGTPYVGLTFTTEDGLSITESFMITEKALPRLQYLHEVWSGKKLEKAFKSEEEVATYFTKMFTSPKAGTRNLIVGGEINGKVTYGTLPYTGFLAGDDMELGAFEEGDENWKKYVKQSNRTSEASGQKQGILNDAGDKGKGGSKNTTKDDDAGEEDTPW